MTRADPQTVPWRAKGLLLENCNCLGVCPGHIHFSNNCSHDRCIGYWAVQIYSGFFGEVDLSGLQCVVAFDSPKKMISGNWTEVIIVDKKASPEQFLALETILTGAAGGPWEVLNRFVGTRLPTKQLSIEILQEGNSKNIKVDNLMESTITPLTGTEKDVPVTIENMFNQIHGSSQIVAHGETNYTDGVITIDTNKTHALISKFIWEMAYS